MVHRNGSNRRRGRWAWKQPCALSVGRKRKSRSRPKNSRGEARKTLKFESRPLFRFLGFFSVLESSVQPLLPNSWQTRLVGRCLLRPIMRRYSPMAVWGQGGLSGSNLYLPSRDFMNTTRILRRVGFFHQLPVVDRIHVLRSLAHQRAAAEEAGVIRYLDAGYLFAAVPGLEDDVLSPQRPIIGPLHVRTDGCFAWPSTLSYWVKQYHISLPQEFIDHMLKCEWSPPPPFDLSGMMLD